LGKDADKLPLQIQPTILREKHRGDKEEGEGEEIIAADFSSDKGFRMKVGFVPSERGIHSQREKMPRINRPTPPPYRNQQKKGGN